MVSTGAAFAPRADLYSGLGGTVEWTCVETGQTSTSLTPTFSHGASATRHYTLTVTPWSALRSLNFGYNGVDGGEQFYRNADWGHAVTPIEACTGLRYATDLEFFTALYSDLQALDLSGLNNLRCVDCYESESLASVQMGSLPALVRIGLEHCLLPELDFSGAPLLEDLRFATQRTTGNVTSFVLGSNPLDRVWHFCANGNDLGGLSPILSGAKTMTALRQWYMWSTHLTGTLALNAGSMQELSVHHNTLSVVDLTNVVWQAGTRTFDASYNPGLSSVILGGSGCNQGAVSSWNISNCGAAATMVDGFLNQLAALGLSGTGKTVNLTGNTAPTSASADARTTLAAAGYTLQLAA